MSDSGNQLTRAELAGLDLLIAGIEEGIIPESALDDISEARPRWVIKVVKAALPYVVATTDYVFGIAPETEVDQRLAQATRDLPETLSLDVLLEARKRATVGE